MATPISRGNHPKAFWPGVKRWWGIEYKPNAQVWPRIFERLDSNQAYEEDVEEVGFGLMSTKNEAGGIVYDTTHQGAVSRYTHITYGLGFIVTMEELQDNLYAKLSLKRTSRLSRSVTETEEILHANQFNRAFDANFAGGDGAAMIDTAHPTDIGNQSNRLSVSADLSEVALEDMAIQIMDTVDSRGLRFANTPRRLIIPSNLRFEAHRILKSQLQSDTANNATNALKDMGTYSEIIPWIYLTDPDAWFVQTDAREGLTHYDRMKATFSQDNDFDTENAKSKVILRFSNGWTQWRQIWGSPGA